MNDTIEIVLSWMIIFMVALFAVVTGEFIGQVNVMDSFHAQVNPIIEEYGGDSDERLSKLTNNPADTQTAQEKISDIAYHMYTHHHIAFVVEPDTSESKNNYPTDFNSNNLQRNQPEYTAYQLVQYQKAEQQRQQELQQHPNRHIPEVPIPSSVTTKEGLHSAVTAIDSGTENQPVAPFGHEINYRIFALTPYNLGNTLLQKMFAASAKFSTVSKVGQD